MIDNTEFKKTVLNIIFKTVLFWDFKFIQNKFSKSLANSLYHTLQDISANQLNTCLIFKLLKTR